jgi:16S rRNA (cytosine967-C5)-methyltransferase
MIYSTCTVNRAENEENVQWMEENLGLVRESLDDYLPETLRSRMTAQGMLQMLPGIQKSDGFFVSMNEALDQAYSYRYDRSGVREKRK